MVVILDSNGISSPGRCRASLRDERQETRDTGIFICTKIDGCGSGASRRA
jgi:hypothetical protein